MFDFLVCMFCVIEIQNTIRAVCLHSEIGTFPLSTRFKTKRIKRKTRYKVQVSDLFFCVCLDFEKLIQERREEQERTSSDAITPRSKKKMARSFFSSFFFSFYKILFPFPSLLSPFLVPLVPHHLHQLCAQERHTFGKVN